ncbi:hypothetical protein C8Q79DRAFT_904731, partial [Trametes meyenii]
EECVLRVQGFLVDTRLPPLRPDQIPSNSHKLMTLKQSVALTGLGIQPFKDASAAIMAIYQQFNLYLKGNGLRQWNPEQAHPYLTLQFANRYLTPAKHAGNEPEVDLCEVVDPFEVLKPRLRSEVHIQDNVVEYWENNGQGERRGSFRRIKPDAIAPGLMVELQITFIAVKLGRNDYAFLPKLRSICVLNRVVHSLLSNQTVSPLKKVKRKIGYDEEKDQMEVEESHRRLKRMSLQDEAKSSGDSAFVP